MGRAFESAIESFDGGLFRWADVDVVRVRKLHVRQLGPQLDARIFAFGAAVTGKAQQILIAQVKQDFVQVWFEGNCGSGSEKISFAASLVGHFAQVVLPQIRERKGAAAMPTTRRMPGIRSGSPKGRPPGTRASS